MQETCKHVAYNTKVGPNMSVESMTLLKIAGGLSTLSGSTGTLIQVIALSGHEF